MEGGREVEKEEEEGSVVALSAVAFLASVLAIRSTEDGVEDDDDKEEEEEEEEDEQSEEEDPLSSESPFFASHNEPRFFIF